MRNLNLVYLCPVIYKPGKRNFADKFVYLSTRCSGNIFTVSSTRHKALPIANFRFHSVSIASPWLVRILRRFYAQTLLPLRVLWSGQPVHAIIAYDPYASGIAGLMLKMFLDTKLIVEVNGDYHRLDPSRNRVKKLLMRLVLHVCLKGCDAIKVLNREQEKFFSQLFPNKPTYRFPEYAATEYFQSLKAYDGDYLLCVGYPFDIKGVDLLIRAFKLITSKHKTIRLKVMGYCPDKDLLRYKELAQNDPRIEFIKPGWIEDVGEQMRGCYALVNAARWEAMGKVHLECMACAKPIVATRTNGALECIEDGRTGLLCEMEDVEDLARKLDYLLSNPDLARQMGQAGLERVRKEFCGEKYTSSFVAMVEEVVTSGR